MQSACKVRLRKENGGFSLLEMVVATAIILILLAVSVPSLMSLVYTVKLGYSATNLSGVLQQARMAAASKNTFYSVSQTTLPGNVTEVFVDLGKTGTLAAADPQAVLGRQITPSFGPGSGAPGETAFVAGLGFTVAAAGSGFPSFNARGLPCLATALGATTCPQTPGQGFVFFLSDIGVSGSVHWAAVTVTASGRSQIWRYDGTNWVRQ